MKKFKEYLEEMFNYYKEIDFEVEAEDVEELKDMICEFGDYDEDKVMDAISIARGIIKEKFPKDRSLNYILEDAIDMMD